ncbi:unnamed protein product [Pieris macdunnoughi]|uniref:UDP-N-acetylglucosamine transferase subunit ALG13 n=1 Tax=Pieris macdunnoughi TaxID=345717 RepID=A0A821RZ40_9NEOP|nr:unnamed protein product [Pieris macdunnoughi]
MATSKYFEKCFITVGTTRFDLLCSEIVSSPVLQALKRSGCKDITFQIGNSKMDTGDYELDGMKLHCYRFKDTIENDIRNSDFVISHAGAGSVLEVLNASKPLLVVVNEDLMDNHQLELAEQMQVDGHLFYCTCDTLVCTLDQMDFSLLKPLEKANPTYFFQSLNRLLKIQD